MMPKPRFVIVGAGFGGIEMAVALKKDGIEDFVILEKGRDVGGVWRDNNYPGCSCDVPSHLYSFSFAPYKGKEKRYPPQADIFAYLRQVAKEFGLLPHIQFDTAVTQAVFQEHTKRWHITTTSDEFFDSECVIFAVGQLHRPNLPDILGREDFQGPVLHPAVWDHDVDLRGKRIALIGTGSSAAQMLPEIASIAHSITVYQRSPSWVLPKPSSDFGLLSRLALRTPLAHTLYRKSLHHSADILLSPITRSKLLRRIAEALAHHHLHAQIKNPTLRSLLTPQYPIGSKRILFDSHVYSALTRPNVTLLTDPITRITPTGIETTTPTAATTTPTPADVIIFATGFKATEFLVPMTVLGRSGRSLNDDWSSGAEAFMGLAVPGYPNAFIIAGPNSFNPAGSNPAMKEVQVGYIMRCLRWRDGMIGPDGEGEQGVAVEVDGGVMEGYREWLGGRMAGSVWGEEGKGEGGGWYIHESGKVTNPWPGSARRFKKMLRGHPREAFRLVD